MMKTARWIFLFPAPNPSRCPDINFSPRRPRAWTSCPDLWYIEVLLPVTADHGTVV